MHNPQILESLLFNLIFKRLNYGKNTLFDIKTFDSQRPVFEGKTEPFLVEMHEI